MSSTEAKPPSRQLTPRDRACLIWIAMQYAIRLDQLQRLLYRYTPEADRYKLRSDIDYVSLDRVYKWIKKWTYYGFIEKDIILHRDQPWIWLTRAGLREVELNFNYSGAPASSRLSHLYFINQVRLAIEAKRPGDVWKSERQIRKEAPAAAKGENQPHTPDAILTNTTNGKMTGIEVEVHSKTDDELEDDLRELAVTYKSIWYFTTSTTRRQIETMLETFEPSMQKPFVLYNLTEYGNGEYGIS
ncbi:MAG TPA: hypothetical protein VEL31_18125 [Ktedonobacteraceae bacterium]|nr:hypothetical protein [Ktedonobacteraceae bacterium]